jgi:hypothetical protein
MMVTGDRVAPRTPLRGATTAAAGSQPEDAFARTLREKGLAADDARAGDDAGGEDGASGNGSSQACALTCPIAPLAELSVPSPAPGGEDGNDGGGPAAGIEAGASTTAASAAATAARSMLAPTAVDVDASAWEASIRDGNGVAVDLRAESAPLGPGQSAAWSVTVVSPALAAEILAQHAPDLTDRLRRRGIASRVRIDGALEERGGAGERPHAANPVRGVGSRHATDEPT